MGRQRNQSALEMYHPFLCLGYYIVVLVMTMFTTNPLLRLFSLLGALLACLLVLDKEEMKRNLKLGVFFLIVAAISNFVFVHRGSTIFFTLSPYLFGKERIWHFTLEALMYGLSFGTLMVSMFLWFQSLSKVLTTDKIIFIFGKFLPKLALVISMVMRFIPLFQKQLGEIQSAQKGLGTSDNSNRKQKIEGGVDNFSSLFSWALENSIDKSDSMNARGFGLKNRTNFSIYHLRRRDFGFAITLITLTISTAYLFRSNGFKFFFYPKLLFPKSNQPTIINYGVIILLVMLPVIIEVKERLKWVYLKSRI